MVDVVWALGGMAALLLIAVAFSQNRRAIRPRTVLAALGLQLGFGILVLYWSVGERALGEATRAVQAVIESSNEGIDFLFGALIPSDGQVFALQVLPVIIFFASLTAVLYHLGVLQRVVAVIGGGIGWLLGTRRAESVNAAANIFVGQTEAPLVIRPYLSSLSTSGLFAVMVGGLSTVAGSVLVGYSLLGAQLEYLIAASFMAAPGALLMAKIMWPEEREPALAVAGATADGATAEGAADRATAASSTSSTPSTPSTSSTSDGERTAAEPDEAGDDEPDSQMKQHRNVIDAAASGAADGLRLAATIGAMLLAFISLIALANLTLGGIGGWFGVEGLTIQQILGYVFAPVMAMVGVPWNEAIDAGSFLGQKIVLNEFVAFSDFAPQADQFSEKGAAVITFALTGFANLASLGILLGGLGGLAPDRRPDIARLGLRAILAATLANLMSAAIAGMLIG